ncbi:MAG: NADH-quinone oxidoreductase subunit NuoF [Planctomycetes bacterium]|nr:NADH-quinone oxidoreductase subunit NuoF [Planctomycetota bacterium]
MPFEPVLSRYFYVKDGHTLEHYMARGQYGGYSAAKKALTEFEPDKLTQYVKESNLRGRGGAGFSTGLKWTFLPKNGKPRYLAVNADESEPGTFKDRQLMAYDPHMLIEGIIIACWAVQSNSAFIFIRGEFAREAVRLQQAIDDCYAAGILGADVLKTGKNFKLDITIIRGAGAYICGEETGLLSAAEGKRAYPKIKPPFPAVEGYFRLPTVINNVETICNLPHLIGRGKEWYMGLGPATGPGPKLYCLSGHVKKPGVYEAPLGTSLRSLIYDYAGGPIGEIKGVIPGGSSMPIFTPDLLDTPMDFDTVRAKGSFLGSAGVIVMNTTTCMVNALLNLARFYHHESCGQCTPCREGLGWLEKLLHRLEFGHAKPDDLNLIKEVSGMVAKRTICLLADSLTMPVDSYMKAYFKEFEFHVREKKCMTGTEPGKFAPVEEPALAR